MNKREVRYGLRYRSCFWDIGERRAIFMFTLIICLHNYDGVANAILQNCNGHPNAILQNCNGHPNAILQNCDGHPNAKERKGKEKKVKEIVF